MIAVNWTILFLAALGIVASAIAVVKSNEVETLRFLVTSLSSTGTETWADNTNADRKVIYVLMQATDHVRYIYVRCAGTDPIYCAKQNVAREWP